MYHKIEDQEKNPDAYVLTSMDPNITEDECHDLFTKPRQTQKTIGLYLKKIPDANVAAGAGNNLETPPRDEKSFTLTTGSHSLEKEVMLNKGFWVGKPQDCALVTYKLRDKYTVDVPKKSQKGQGIFCRPDYMELDYRIKLANAGLLYTDEEDSESESEEENQQDNTGCLPLRKTKYKIPDPCKPEEKEKKAEEGPPKDVIEEMMREGKKPNFKKVPTGCQCDYLGEHNRCPTVWDNPFEDRVDMLRQHELNKCMKPFKNEILNKNYDKNPPVKFVFRESGTKKTFPIYSISNL